MRIRDKKTPVLILNCRIGGLAIMRSLGSLGVPVYGIESDPRSAALGSRYCMEKFIKSYDEDNAQDYLEYVLEKGKQLGGRCVLIPTSDELSVFVAAHKEELSEHFLFTRNRAELVRDLISKEGMYRLVGEHDVPTAHTIFPKGLEEVEHYAEHGEFPLMLKGIYGNQLEARTGKKMVIVHSGEELMVNYRLLNDGGPPNLMLQEYIPGTDDQIYIFNGYFDDESKCLAAFTGRKIRQFPVHVGCASLGVCSWHEEVASMTTRFMKDIGFRGILDIGYRKDPRNGLYKVLDVNPRVGQAFRLFTAEDGMDVVRAMYLDITGQKVPRDDPREGRKWLIEDYDIISSIHYVQEGSLTFKEWARSFKGVEEGAWFSWKDPIPFLIMVKLLAIKSARWVGKIIRRKG